MDTEARIGALYAEPLDEFIRARDLLSRELRDAGDPDSAARVAKLRKPNVPAWSVNQLARRAGDELGRLFALRDEMAGAGGDELRRLSAERRELVARLVGQASAILEEAGHSATAAHVERITQTLQAGSDPAEREAIVGGRLARELAPSGFEAAFGSDLALDEVELTDTKSSREARRHAEELASIADETEREARVLERAAKQAAVAAQEAEAAARAARRRAATARKEADAASARVS